MKRVFCSGLLSGDASGMQTVYTCFSVVEVDLTFNSDVSPVGMVLMDLVHIIYILDDWKFALFGDVIYHRVAQTVCSDFFSFPY